MAARVVMVVVEFGAVADEIFVPDPAATDKHDGITRIMAVNKTINKKPVNKNCLFFKTMNSLVIIKHYVVNPPTPIYHCTLKWVNGAEPILGIIKRLIKLGTTSTIENPPYGNILADRGIRLNRVSNFYGLWRNLGWGC